MEQNPNIRAIIYYERVEPHDVPGVHYNEAGRLTKQSLAAYLPEGPADFYYCGSVGFMSAVDHILDQLEIPMECRYTEAFAPDPSFATEIARSAPLPAGV